MAGTAIWLGNQIFAPVPGIKNEKSAQRGSFRAGYPADIRGSFARISRPNTSVRVLKKNKHLGADIHDPKARTSTTLRDFQELRSEKLWAEFSFPRVGHVLVKASCSPYFPPIFLISKFFLEREINCNQGAM